MIATQTCSVMQCSVDYLTQSLVDDNTLSPTLSSPISYQMRYNTPPFDSESPPLSTQVFRQQESDNLEHWLVFSAPHTTPSQSTQSPSPQVHQDHPQTLETQTNTQWSVGYLTQGSVNDTLSPTMTNDAGIILATQREESKSSNAQHILSSPGLSPLHPQTNDAEIILATQREDSIRT
jgi:hypothetical protein